MYRITGGNVKLGNMGSFSKLYGNQVYAVAGYGEIVGTCGGNCEACAGACYVRKSYRYPSVIKNHAKNTDGMRAHMGEMFIETAEEFRAWLSLAEKHPESEFYIYTKAYAIVLPELLKIGKLPANFALLVSVWHEIGAKEYEAVKHIDGVKAFVYVDNFDYSGVISWGTRCKAYDENGKLDHNITCDKCRKCFNRNPKHAVIACYEH